MKFIPILFSTPMVKAIMEGRKTQTRRVVKHNLLSIHPQSGGDMATSWCDKPGEPITVSLSDFLKSCPYGQPGDVLWVRETWCQVMRDHAHDLLEGAKDNSLFVRPTQVHSDWMEYAKERYGYKWKPSIHMPKSACRLWGKVKAIRVERLQEISEMDAAKEGVESCNDGKNYVNYNFDSATHRMRDRKALLGSMTGTAYASFQSLWQTINGVESWKMNPWVWVVEFEVLTSKPENFI